MKKMLIGIVISAGLLVGNTVTQACTDFRFKAQDGTVLVTRTMEFSAELNSNLRSSNRGRVFQVAAPDGKPGMTWRSTYGYVFLDALNVDVAVDGMNEAGLSVEALFLPGITQYQTVPVGQEKQALPYINFGDWVLSNFKTVDEVKYALNSVYVYEAKIPGMGNTVFPLHFSIYDASGKGIVVEYVNGELKMYENEVGVLTNNPTYDWQVTNLRDYVNLSPWSPSPVVIGNLVFAATGQGSGMKGLPGDTSPPSRFVKMTAMLNTVYPAMNAKSALNTVQHIINNVDIPAGFVRAKNGTKSTFELTQWTVFKDLTNKTFYYKTYGDTTLRSVTLTQLDFSSTAPRLKMPIATSQHVFDMTKDFQQTKS